MLTRLGAEHAKNIAALAIAAREARDRELRVRPQSLDELEPARGEHNPFASLGLDPLSPDDPAVAALRDAIARLPIAPQHELRTLDWIGRGDYSGKDWSRAFDISQNALASPIDELLGEADLHENLMKALYELKLL
jgi:hypothetical protein